MEFGLFVQAHVPRHEVEANPAGAEHVRLLRELELAEACDRSGFKYVWSVEHHFLEEYSHLSASEIFLPYIAARTKRIHVSLSPRDWNKTNIVPMCDAMNFVLDPAHAETYERKIGRRGVCFTLEQARRFVAGTGKARMWQYDRVPDYLRPQKIIDGIRALGVDVSGWGE